MNLMRTYYIRHVVMRPLVLVMFTVIQLLPWPHGMVKYPLDAHFRISLEVEVYPDTLGHCFLPIVGKYTCVITVIGCTSSQLMHLIYFDLNVY